MKMFPMLALASALSVGTCAMLPGCSTAPRTEEGRLEIQSESQRAMERFVATDSSMEAHFQNAYGYAIFPNVGRGGAGVGGAYGRGTVYEQGDLIGYCDLSQGTIGFQLGGQAYSQVIFFQHKGALDRFTSGEFAFAAQASAVAATAGASADAAYDGGVMVFTMTRGGLMYEASIGGQKFTFEPVDPTE